MGSVIAYPALSRAMELLSVQLAAEQACTLVQQMEASGDAVYDISIVLGAEGLRVNMDARTTPASIAVKDR